MDPATMGLIMGGTGLMSGLGSFLGNSGAADDMEKAAEIALQQQREAQAYNKEMYGKAETGLNPYLQGGLGALPYYLNLASGGKLGESFDVTDSPAYSYQQGKIEDAINRKYASMGMGQSRAAVNSLSDANAGLAANEFDRSFGRLGGLVNMGFGGQQYLGNLGMGAASTNANILQTGAQQYGNMMGQSAGYNNAATQALGNLGRTTLGGYQQGMAYGQNQQMNDQIMKYLPAFMGG